MGEDEIVPEDGKERGRRKRDKEEKEK